MADTIQRQFAGLCRATRVRLDVTQYQLARAAGVSRPVISAIECGRADPTLGLVDRLSGALGLELALAARPPVVIGNRQRDLVHARCSGFVQRRLETAGFLCRREVQIASHRSHGWLDLAAFDPRTGVLYVIEIKTVLDDIGSLERQLGWYVRVAPTIPDLRVWQATRVQGWALVLATEEVDHAIRHNRDVLALAFPSRAVAMRAALEGKESPERGWGLALIDPSSRRRAWLQPTRQEGRRTPAPYRNYPDAASRMGDRTGRDWHPTADGT